MRTDFLPELLADPKMAASEAVIRKCVHCGFCTATCPTYVLLGDELDSPRGRIYLMKEMLEKNRDPSPETVKHVDRCLSCLSCVTTCPSGVNYMQLVDHARAYIEARYRRPLLDRLLRSVLANILPHVRRFRIALRLARFAKPLAPLLGGIKGLAPVAAMLKLAPARLPKPARHGDVLKTHPRGRVVMLGGCAEPVLKPQYQAAAVRLLDRIGYEVVFARGAGCCGALVHHLGRSDAALASVRRNVDAWWEEFESGSIEAIVLTASGCGSMIKEYGSLLRHDPHYAVKAAAVSFRARDITEFLAEAGLPAGNGHGMTVAYHGACSLQHGQKVTSEPRILLANAGYHVLVPDDAHLCCGSAGTYNILQPALSGQLRDRKIASLDRLAVDVIATGNIGCAVQLAAGATPVVHIVELLDWATGGPPPAGFGKDKGAMGDADND